MDKKTLITIFAATFFVVLLFYLYSNQQRRETTTHNTSGLTYEECEKLPDSSIEDSLPPVCVTEDGTRVTGTIEDEDEDELVRDLNMSNWESFANELVSVGFSYPPSWGSPRISSTSSKNEVRFDNDFTVTRGVYYTNERDRILTFDEYIEQNTPNRRLITNYEIDNIQLKRASYDYSSSERAELFVFPPNPNGEIVSIFFHYPKNDLQTIREFFGLLTTVETISDSTPLSDDEIGQSPSECVITGCSNQVCAEEEVITTCEYKEEYACYENATCERQDNGECGWTMTDDLQSCLNISQ